MAYTAVTPKQIDINMTLKLLREENQVVDMINNALERKRKGLDYRSYKFLDDLSQEIYTKEELINELNNL